MIKEEKDNNHTNQIHNTSESITRVTGMYKDWFLDYASYVILERAVPAIEDGFKPVNKSNFMKRLRHFKILVERKSIGNVAYVSNNKNHLSNGNF